MFDQSGNDNISNILASEKVYQWTGNIGLPNVTDVFRADAFPGQCLGAEPTGTMGIFQCISIYNYLAYNVTTFTSYWTMNGYATESWTTSYSVWRVERTSEFGHPSFNLGYSSHSFGVRPVLFLKSTIQIISGDGTKSTPYIIQ